MNLRHSLSQTARGRASSSVVRLASGTTAVALLRSLRRALGRGALLPILAIYGVWIAGCDRPTDSIELQEGEVREIAGCRVKLHFACRNEDETSGVASLSYSCRERTQEEAWWGGGTEPAGFGLGEGDCFGPVE